MDSKLYAIILLFGILGCIHTWNFFIVAPNSLRLNADESIYIITEGYGGRVDVIVEDYPGKMRNISKMESEVHPGKPKLFKLRLDPRSFPPSFLTNADSPKLVSIRAEFLNLYKEIIIPLTVQSGYVFVQTDKPIYTPKERVSIRIIPLDEDNMPFEKPLRCEIRNPSGDIVEQKDLISNGGEKRDSAFKTVTYHFPTYPVFGEWSVRVYYGYNLMQNSTVHFELKEYVLPFFTVELQTPDVVLPSDEKINIKVYAKYSYGQKVKGFVSLRIGIKNITGHTSFFATSHNELEDGAFNLNLNVSHVTSHVQKIVGVAFPEDCRLHVQATVVDFATGNEEAAEDTKTTFASSPFHISFRRCLRDFRPGFTSLVEADVIYKNGQPAEGVMVTVSAVADNGRPLTIVNSQATTDVDGKVSFEVHPELNHKLITITLRTAGDWPSTGTVQQIASSNNTFIMISRIHPPRLRPNDLFSRGIEFEPPGINNIYFLVAARGKIVTMDKLPEGEYENHRLKFPITHEMVPSFRILVFAQHGNKLLADSLKIDVENVCHPDAKVTIVTDFAVKQPGYSGKIIISGTKNTSVGLMGVDEAVYGMSKKDLLTKAKVFNTLASHDLGCGPGGGTTIDAILGNAGITMATNIYTSSLSHSCVERKRRKREIFVEMENAYTGFEKRCCSLGLEFDSKHRDCQERKAIVDNYLTEEEYLNCSKVFFECCEYMQKIFPAFEISRFDVWGRRTSEELPDFLEADKEDKEQAKLNLRRDFQQTWIFTDLVIGPDAKEEKWFTLPGSITTWVIQAVSLSPKHGVCVAEPTKIESTKKVFVHLNLPYSVVRNEQVEIQAVIFNYVNVAIGASVYLYGVEDLCSGTLPGKKSERKEIVVEPFSSGTVTFPVIPLKANIIPIKVVVFSLFGSDVVQKDLHVIPEGVVKELKIPTIQLDPTNQQKRGERSISMLPYVTDKLDVSQNLQTTNIHLLTPENFVPGTASCSIKIVGDIYGPAVETSINDPEKLIELPTRCGEQNIAKLAPTLYTMRYLKVSGKLTAELEGKGYDYIRKGYANQLNYKKDDGSYAAFPWRKTNTWLTAFVIKVLCQATELVHIDEEVLCSGVRWLIDNQQPDGSYIENEPLYSPELMGGLQGKPPMTAFVVIALEECKCDEERLFLAKERSVSYLENHLEEATSPLSAAIIAYALALSNSEFKQIANARLLSMASTDKGRNWLYWPTENSAQDIQTSAYALLTQLLFNDIDKSTSIVNWLNLQQLSSGSYKSTQDTVIALQAMSEYVIRARMPTLDLKTNITSSKDAHFERQLVFNERNARVVREVKINQVDGILFIKTSGVGVGALSVKLRYNVIEPPESICKFDIKINITDKKNEDVLNGLQVELVNGNTGAKSKDKKLRYSLEICVRYLGNKDAEMSIVDVELFSGFVPVEGDLSKIINNSSQLIQEYEMAPRGVKFYLKKIPSSYDYCFSFHVIREFIVGNTRMCAIQVYDYYNPDTRCTKFYKPGSNSPMIRKLCKDGICQCAEGGCPLKKFSRDPLLKPEIRRDKLMKDFCDNYDYAWIGKLSGNIRNDGGFLNISFLVQDVIKAGIQKAEDTEDTKVTLLARDDCDKIYEGVEYLVLGKDGEMYMNENGVPWYRYLLDQSSIVYMWVSEPTKATDRGLQRDLIYVTKKLKKDGCDG